MGAGTAYAAVYLAASAHSDWPVDLGDDPSFESSRLFARSGGCLSWGVCRPDLRNCVAKDDLVVFLSAERLHDRRPARYRLVGWGTVSHLVSQIDLWRQEELAVYRSYRNLLVRPSQDMTNFIHHESQEPWHDDWVWRLARKDRRGPAKARWLAAAQGDVPADGTFVVDGQPRQLAANYILFAPEGAGTVVLADPPVVATVAKPGELEAWFNNSLANDLRALLLNGRIDRGLRTTNPQQPHRHLRLTTDATTVREQLSLLIHREGLPQR